MAHSNPAASPLSNNAITYYGRKPYFADLTARLMQCRSGDYAVLMAMIYDPSPTEFQQLSEAMSTATRQGAEVHLLVDAYVFLTNDFGNLGPLFFRSELSKAPLPKRYAVIYEGLERLRKEGVQYHITNLPRRRFSNPLAGRSHIKCALINDRIYIGGCNFDCPEHADIMLGWNDAVTAHWVRAAIEKIISNGSIRRALGNEDIRHDIDDVTTLLIDTGVARQSLILQEALELVDRAQKRLYLTTQYFPNGEMIKRLKQAYDRGVDVAIVYNHIDKNDRLWLLHKLNFLHKQHSLPPAFFAHELPKSAPYVHAKILASEHEAMVGSHNYVTPGVRFGTAEIALHRRDPAFATRIVKEFQTYI